MPTPKLSFKLLLATLIYTLLGVTAAHAPGSISLDEVMQQLNHDATLISELKAELKKQGLNAEDVICVGARFGHHWTHLGGARAIPYECKLGTRTINIDGELHLYDKTGKELDMGASGTPENAVSYKQLNLTWTWS